jgi:hypothetical protein
MRRVVFLLLLLISVLLGACAGGGSDQIRVGQNNRGPGNTNPDPTDKGKDGFSYMQDGSGSADVDLIRHKTSF